MIRRSNRIRVLGWVFGGGLVPILGCLYHCDDPEPLESGDYTVVERLYGPDEQQWLPGAQLMVDRAEGIATLRYTRDGTTYEVHYTLYP